MIKDNYNSPDDAVYSRGSEERYADLLRSLPSTYKVRHAFPEEDMRQHFDVLVIDCDSIAWYDDVKTVRRQNRHGHGTKYCVSEDIVRFITELNNSNKRILIRYRIVLERYDDAGDVMNSYLRFRWYDILTMAPDSIVSHGNTFLFDPSVAIAADVRYEVIEPDIP